jgi:hypothetical protein
MALSLAQLQAALPQGGLFGGGAWRWSPEPLKLTAAEAHTITRLGHPLAQFQKASDEIYRRSAKGKLPGWISTLLDAGKPSWLIDQQRRPETAGLLPRVIRPDLILGATGPSLTELDSVPGGIGVTAWMSQVYADAGFDVLGGRDGMLDGFRSLLPTGGAILVSDEAGDYRPEMKWLAEQLGTPWEVLSAEAYEPDGRNLYRFFELFDWKAIPAIQRIADKIAAGESGVSSPFKPHLEDKLWLALLWSPGLRRIWEQTMRKNHLDRIREIVPFGWIPDPAPLPPQAALPKLNVNSWEEVASFSQKERQLVLKISGFHETAWGSRGVYIGHDLPATEWKLRIEEAVASVGQQPWLMQEFREGRLIDHPVFAEDGSIEIMRGRARVCPYFFTNDEGETTFAGCLATLVPADKKKIHGMSDGVLVPCVVG